MGNFLARISKIALPGGQQFTTGTDPEDFDLRQLSINTGFTYRQVEQLKERFEELCRDSRDRDEIPSLLKRQDLLSLPEYKKHPLRERIVDVFMRFKCGTNQMEFKDFLETLSQFRSTPSSSSKNEEIRENKLRFLFEIYDITNDGFIDDNDMHTTAKKLFPNEDKEELVNIVEALIKEMDADHDGKVSFEDFCTTMTSIDIDSKVSIPFLNRKI